MSKNIKEQKESGIGFANASFIFQEAEELSAPGPGQWFFFPRGADGISIMLASSGDGRVEATNASYDDIVDDTVPADQINAWPKGNIGAAVEDDLLKMANAFRQVNISGTTKMSVVAVN